MQIHDQPRSLDFDAILNNKTSENSQIKAGREGLYTNSYKPTGFFSSAIKAFSFLARLLPGGSAAQFRAANTQIREHIEEKFGVAARKAFDEEFQSRSTFGQPLTAGRIRQFFFALLDNQSVTLSQEGRVELLMAKLTSLYGQEKTASFQENFLRGTVSNATSEKIKNAFETTSPAEKTVTLLSLDIKSTGELGFDINPDHQLTNVLLPLGGAVIIHGKETRNFMAQQIARSPSFKNSSTIKEQAEKVDWGRKNIVINGKPLALKSKGEADYSDHNLKLLSSALALDVAFPRAHQELHDILSLISKENTSAGYPSGADSETGMRLSEEFVMGETSPPTIEINRSTEGKIHIDYTSPRAFFSGFTAPGNITSNLLKVTGGHDLDRLGEDKELPHLEVATKYTYEYTPPSEDAQQGTIAVIDSRQAYWPAPKILSSDL